MDQRYKFRGMEFVGVPSGSMPYIGAGGVLKFRPLPADAAVQEANGTPYFWGIVGDLPDWRTVNATVVATGWGYSWGNDWGGPDT